MNNELIVGEKDRGCWILLLLKLKKFMIGFIKSVSKVLVSLTQLI